MGPMPPPFPGAGMWGAAKPRTALSPSSCQSVQLFVVYTFYFEVLISTK